ncbi:unnamed protein product [Hermetia illucens]|uniref:RRM domain-containing protein n=1 Tax=Hermetia illucens TaxID=343691 RepID=A0A7R8UII5_HERIL|nr:unnamed protein product [Hermetia illucens]
MNNGASLNNAVGRTGKRPFAALGSPDESDTSPLVTLQKNCTIELRRIPRWLNTVAQLDSYFSKYGKVMSIRIAYQADPEAATVTFEDDIVASVAYKSIVEKGSWCSPHNPNTSGNPNKQRKYCSTKHVYRHMELDKIEDILKRKRELLQGYLEQLKMVTGLAAKSDAVETDHEQKLDLVKQLTASIESMHEEIALDEVQVATKMFYEMPIDKAISTISDDEAKPQPIDFPAVPPLTESWNVTTSKVTLGSVSVPFKNAVVDRSEAIPALTEDETLTSINIRNDSSGTPDHQPESSEFKRDSDVGVADTGSNNKAPDLGNEIEDPPIIEISDDDDCLEFDYEYPELL